MSIRLANKLSVTLLVLGGVLLFFRAQAEDKSAKPEQSPASSQKEYTEKTSNQATKELLKLSNRQDGLKKLEDELNQPLREFSPKGSLDGAFAPPMFPPAPRQVIPNKRLQELLEKQKNWIFMTPDELLAPPSAEDVLNVPKYGPDGQEKKKLTPLERFYESLGNKSDNDLSSKPLKDEDPLGPHRGLGKDEQDEKDNLLPSGVKNSEKELRKLFSVDSSNTGNASGTSQSLSDFFGLGEHTLTPQEVKAHQEYIKRFQDVLNSGPPPELNPLAKPAETSPALTSTGGLPSMERPDGYDPHLGTVNPTYVPSGSVDVNSKVLNSWNPNYTPPPPPVVHLAPPTPNFTPPRRVF